MIMTPMTAPTYPCTSNRKKKTRIDETRVAVVKNASYSASTPEAESASDFQRFPSLRKYIPMTIFMTMAMQIIAKSVAAKTDVTG